MAVNKVPPIGTYLLLKDGETVIVVCGWYDKGNGGWRIKVHHKNDDRVGWTIGLRDIKRRLDGTI